MDNPEIQTALGTQDEANKNKHKAETKSNAYTLYKYDDLFIYIEMTLKTAVSHRLLTCQCYHYLFLIINIIKKSLKISKR